MFWQFAVPGAHTVTVTKAVSTELKPVPGGPASTISATVLPAPPPPPPLFTTLLLPPQPASTIKAPDKPRTISLDTLNLLICCFITLLPRAQHPRATTEGCKLGRQTRAYDRPS